MSQIKTVEEALSAQRSDIIIQRGKDVTVGPDVPEYKKFFHKVKIASFKDLKALHFIPEKLDEAKAREAMDADYAGVLKLVDTHMARLDLAAMPTRPRWGAMRRSTYLDIRKRSNTNLASEISKCYGTPVLVESPEVMAVAYTIAKLDRLKSMFGNLFITEDITIQNNATLNVSRHTTYMGARHIKIHTGGKLKITGSYLKIVCDSLEGDIP